MVTVDDDGWVLDFRGEVCDSGGGLSRKAVDAFMGMGPASAEEAEEADPTERPMCDRCW